MQFGEFLRARRLEKKMSIRQLALYSQCSDSYLSVLERDAGGRRRPTPEFLRKLVKPLGVPYEVLLAAAGYTLQTTDEWVCTGAMVLMLRRVVGDDVVVFAQRVGMNPSDIEEIERAGVAYETFEGMLKKLFVWDCILTPDQKEMIPRIRSKLDKLPAERSMQVQLFMDHMLALIEQTFL